MKTLLLLCLLGLPCVAQDKPPRWDPPKHQPDERPTHRLWEQQDYGPFLTAAVSMPWPAGAVTQKGIVLKVGKSSICFDTDLLRYAGGWSDGWLELLGPPFEGSRSAGLGAAAGPFRPSAEPGVFVCRAGFASRGMTVGRAPHGTRPRPVRDPRCLGSRSLRTGT